MAAQAAVRMARNKTKSVITSANFDAVRDLAGDTLEGQRLLSLIRQSNELTAIHNSGYQGGVSRITDQFSPIGSQASYDRGFSTIESTIRPVAALGAGVMNPAIPAAQAAAVGIGRGIDAPLVAAAAFAATSSRTPASQASRYKKTPQAFASSASTKTTSAKHSLRLKKQQKPSKLADNKAMHKAIYEANGRFFESHRSSCCSMASVLVRSALCSC